MSLIHDLYSDFLIILKLFLFNIYFYLESLYKNVLPLSFTTESNILEGEIVLITGAAGGIGKNLVKLLLNLGCIVICIDNNSHELSKLKNELKYKNNRSFKNRLFYYCIDITDIEQVKSTGNRIKKEVGSVSILINNAGIMNHGKLFLQLSEEEIMRLFNVNLFSHFWLCKEFLPEMIELNKGHIVNISSVCGLMGAYKLTDYCSSKFAVVGFTESLRVELKTVNPDNQIVVSTVCPFHVKTKLFNGIEFSHLKWLKLSMEPEYVAQKIVDGILLKKELIFIPSFSTSVFVAIRNLVTTKFLDMAQICFDLNGSMDRYRKIK